jgi:hypothetical protein
MEQEKQDKLIQDLINHLVEHRAFYVEEYKKMANLSDGDWNEIRIFALNNDFMTERGGNHCYGITQKTFRYDGVRYIDEAPKMRIEIELQHKKNEERERKEAKKLDADLTLARWQKRTFWWVFGLGAIGGICGIVSLCLQLTAKPIIEKEYIHVDSHGKTYKNEN